MRRLSRSAVRRGNSVLPPLRIPSVSSRRQLSIDGSDNNNTRNNGPFTSFTDEGNATGKYLYAPIFMYLIVNVLEFSRNVRRLNRATSVPPPNSRIAQEYEPFLTVNPFANEAETISVFLAYLSQFL